MATKRGVIISHPRSKSQTPSPGTDQLRRKEQSVPNQYARQERDIVRLPPGRENFIVRTPYPFPLSEEDKKSP